MTEQKVEGTVLGIDLFELIWSNSPPCYLTISGDIVTSYEITNTALFARLTL